ncbi:MAG: hypothetical protein KBT27_09180 [Prevotellaceae bacterium]|nr:hypothetical protein [Candidatus Faecinaster equi]
MKSIGDYLICDKCEHDMYEYSTDEIYFSNDNTGHYFVDVWCPECGNHKRACIYFTYDITDFYYR